MKPFPVNNRRANNSLTRRARLVLLLAVSAVAAFADTPVLREAVASPSDFPVVVSRRAAAIVLDPAAPAVLRIAADLLASDIARVSGLKPALLDSASGQTAPLILLGTLDSPLIAELVRREKFKPASLTGRWEAFQIATIADPFPGVPSALVIVGSDRRGAAYGAMTLSQTLGVSPWEWWADVPVAHRDTLVVSTGAGFADQPAVRYRGIFLNDEDWGLLPWAAKTFEPEAGTIGPRTHARLFELMLRLRANTFWPAMHKCTTPFHLVPGNNAVADSYGIILGSSHAEPMLRNNVGEWTAPPDTYNYITHRDGVLAYWEERVRQRTSGESLFTLGMRGIHDSAIVGPKNQTERIATLGQIFADQRELLARHLGGGDPTRVPQIFVPYKEVLDDYNAGLPVPADATLVWPDDNFGYVRRFATPAERARPGGLGVYYHLSYLGAPLSWLWFDSLPPALVWSEMTRAYEQGARTFWIANVGDLKANELSTEFFLQLAWNADRTGPDAPAAFLHTVAARDFSPAYADAIADLWARHQALAFARKPEHLQWYLPTTPATPSPFSGTDYGDEITRRLTAYASLLRDTDALAARLPIELKDAFFELVGYPIKSAAAANERVFRLALDRLHTSQGRTSASAHYTAAHQADQAIKELTRRYNEQVAGGKWRGLLTINGLSTREWKRFQPDPLTIEAPTLAAPANNFVAVSRLAIAAEGAEPAATVPGAEAITPVTRPLHAALGESRFIDVFNQGSAPAAWSVASDIPGLKFSPPSGNLATDTRLFVTVDAAALPLTASGAVEALVTIRTEQESRQIRIPIIARAPEESRPGDFIEVGGVVALRPDHFTTRTDGPDAGWRAIPGLGRSGAAVVVQPSTATLTAADAPRLSYRFHVATGGAATLRVRLLPTHPLVSGKGLRFAFAVDDGAPISAVLTTGFDPKSEAWKHRVLANATEVATPFPVPLTPGAHTLHLLAVDAGVVVDKIVIDLGGLRPSYDGPPETRLPTGL